MVRVRGRGGGREKGDGGVMGGRKGRENKKTRERERERERESGTYGTIVSKFGVLRPVDRREGRAREKEKERGAIH